MEGAEPEEANRLLQEICRQITAMLAVVPARPRRLSVTAGQVAVEFEWPDGPGPVVPGPVVPEETRHGARQEDDGVFYVRALTVGTFYRSPQPGARPFVVEGEHVLLGQQVGILEAMKMMLPVEAHRSGLVEIFLAEDGAPVEFDAPLVALRPDETAPG